MVRIKLGPMSDATAVVVGVRQVRTPSTIRDMVEECAPRYGHRVAYRIRERRNYRSLTYDELRRRSSDFAAGLIGLGLRQGDRVAIICENGLEWVIGYFGQSVAGGVGVPLYTEMKGPEIEELLRRSGARYVIASTKVLARLREDLPGVAKIIAVGDSVEARVGTAPGFLRRGRPDLVPFEQVASAANEESRHALAATRIQPDDLASIVFTSGTTGGMKGVMLTHRNFMSNVDSMRRSLPVGERDRLLMVLPLHHAFPFTIGLLALVTLGGEVTFENDLLRVRERMLETRPTVFVGVPALFDLMYRAIVARIEAEGQKRRFEAGLRLVDTVKARTGVNIGREVFRDLHNRLGGKLRFMISGGAALNPQVALNYLRLGMPLLQGWGLTEAAPVVSVQRWWPNRFRFGRYYEEHVASVGRPLEGIEVALIDVPEKEIYVHLHGEGELVVRGPNVSPGYWQAEEETRASRAGEWLRTGDLGHIDEEGNIWITGRSKYVIVLDSGEKVIPEELEDKMGESPLIEDICVVPRRIRNKTMLGAIIYPGFEAARERCSVEHLSLDEESLRTLVTAELERFAADMAPYKRISEVILTDTPLARTHGLRKIARGQIKESYPFDLKRWERNALGALAPAEEPPQEG